MPVMMAMLVVIAEYASVVRGAEIVLDECKVVSNDMTMFVLPSFFAKKSESRCATNDVFIVNNFAFVTLFSFSGRHLLEYHR